MSWEKVKLEDVIEKPLSGEWGEEGNGVFVLRTTNFSNDGTLDLEDVVKRNIPFDKVNKKKLLFGDTILEKSGGSPTQPVGRVVYFNIEGNETYLCNNFTSVLRPLKIVNSKYLFWFLFNNHISKQTLRYQNKTTGIINLQTERYLSELQVPLPPLPTQQKIAAILDKADELRKKDQQLLAHYDALLQSIFYDMFGDPVKNEKGWENAIVIDNCNCIVPGRDKPKSFTGNIPWITTDDLEFLGFTSKSKRNIGLTQGEIEEVRARIIPQNSVLMTCVGDLGIISIAGTDMVVNQQLHTFQPNDKLNNIFLMFMLSYRKDYMVKMASSTTLPYMNKTICNSVPILVPPISLQNQFAAIAQNIQQQKQQVKQQQQQSEVLFQGLLQRAFKGELIK